MSQLGKYFQNYIWATSLKERTTGRKQVQEDVFGCIYECCVTIASTGNHITSLYITAGNHTVQQLTEFLISTDLYIIFNSLSKLPRSHGALHILDLFFNLYFISEKPGCRVLHIKQHNTCSHTCMRIQNMFEVDCVW